MQEGFRITRRRKKHIHFYLVPVKIIFLKSSIHESQESCLGKKTAPFSIRKWNIRAYIIGYSEAELKCLKNIFNILN